ncbi:MAG: hypothetical protein O9301_01815 [Leptospira sp.]|nr:hypothetical protein [Leptospira sp.]
MEIEQSEREKTLAKKKELEFTKENQLKKDALLCYRTLQRQPEMKEGTAQVLKDTFLKNYAAQANDIDWNSQKSVEDSIAKILTSSGRYRILNIQDFYNRVANGFKKEVVYKKDRRNQFSLEILFQTIDLLSVGKSQESKETSVTLEGDLSVQERESMLQSFRIYNALNQKILGLGNLKDAMLKKDLLVDELALTYRETTITAIELMFRNIIAQQLLAKKYRCDTLLSEWKKEYGFDDGMTTRIETYIPKDTPLLQFRSKYAHAVQTIKIQEVSKANVFDSDLFLLRSLANYYTSWIMQVAEMV